MAAKKQTVASKTRAAKRANKAAPPAVATVARIVARTNKPADKARDALQSSASYLAIAAAARAEAGSAVGLSEARAASGAAIKTACTNADTFHADANALISGVYSNEYLAEYMVRMGHAKTMTADEAAAIRAKAGATSQSPDRRTDAMERACGAMRKAAFAMRQRLEVLTEETRGGANNPKGRAARTPAKVEVKPEAPREVAPALPTAPLAIDWLKQECAALVTFQKKNAKQVPAVVASAIQDLNRIVNAWRAE